MAGYFARQAWWDKSQLPDKEWECRQTLTDHRHTEKCAHHNIAGVQPKPAQLDGQVVAAAHSHQCKDICVPRVLQPLVYSRDSYCESLYNL